MPNPVRHFAIHADDVERARAFYERAFGWTFEPWGPPEFYLIHTGVPGGIEGALQRRREPLAGSGMRGYECTIAVHNLDEALTNVKEAGGQILHPKMAIPGVGELFQFQDPEGNIGCAMRYDHLDTC